MKITVYCVIPAEGESALNTNSGIKELLACVVEVLSSG